MVPNSSLDLSRQDGRRVKVERIVHWLREAGHVVRFVAVQPGDVVLADTGYGLLQFFEAARIDAGGGGTSPPRLSPLASLELLRFGEEHDIPRAELAASDRAFCAGRRAFRECDLVHALLSPSDVGSMLCARLLGIPLVVEANGPPLFEPGLSPPERPGGESERFARLCSELTLGSAGAVAAVSPSVRDVLVSEWGVDNSHIVVLPNAAEVPAPGSSDRLAKYRHDYDLRGAPVVIYAGALQAWCGVEHLLEAFVRVREKHPEAMLLIVGDGPSADELQARAARFDLFASVRFAGSVPHEAVGALLDLAAVAVAPYSRSAFDFHSSPVKIFEYMAAGKAIVASRVGAITEILRSDETAVLVEPGVPAELAEAIGHLLSDGARRRRLGDRARREAVENHTWEGYVRRLVGVYEGALSRFQEARAARGALADDRSAMTLPQAAQPGRPRES